jgi:hypothetical protein
MEAKEGLLFWRKEAKDFDKLVRAGCRSAAALAEVFWFFSSEKNAFLLVARGEHNGKSGLSGRA